MTLSEGIPGKEYEVISVDVNEKSAGGWRLSG